MANLFTFRHPIPFPRSEYGGVWVVVANDAAEAAQMAYDEYMDDSVPIEDFEDAVCDGTRFELVGDVAPRIVESFLT
jgi:hypothetical protein